VYRTFNAIFGKIERIASNDVVIELFKTKCLPVLLYGMEACPVKKLHIKLTPCSLLLTVLLFNTRSKEVIEAYQCYFNREPISELINRRTQRFFYANTVCWTIYFVQRCSVL